MTNFWQKIDKNTLKTFRQYLAMRGASAKSLKRKESSLRKFFSWAVREGYLKENPFIQKASLITNYKLLISKAKLPLRAYRALPYFTYLNFLILIIFLAALGFGIYQQFIQKAPEKLAYPAAPVVPNRYLSFQGRLTDSANTPITTATNMRFRLYDASSGGNTLWDSGTCSIDPDEDGIFNTILGSDCGGAIASSVFSENASVWLGITVGSDSEATPRIQIATVGYALNAETLQGFPLASATNAEPTATMGATVRTVPAINPAGNLIIASASPKIWSTSGTFQIRGQALSIVTDTGTNGNIAIAPDGSGVLNLTLSGGTGNVISATDANLGSSGGREANTLLYGSVANNNTNLNLLKLESGSTPSPKFTVDYSGNASAAGILRANTTGSYFTGDITVSGGDITGAGGVSLDIGEQSASYIVSSAGISVGGGTTYYINSSGTGNLNALTLAGNLTLNANVASNLIPSSGNTYDLGSTSLYWNNLYVNNIYGGSSGTSGYWTKTSGVIYPNNTYESVAIGGTATSSAKLYFEGTTGNASMSGTLTIGQGQTIRPAYGPLQLAYKSGADAWTTGMVMTEQGYVGIGTTNPGQKLDVLGSIQAAGHILPSGANRHLGLSTSHWSSLYVDYFRHSDSDNYFIGPAAYGEWIIKGEGDATHNAVTLSDYTTGKGLSILGNGDTYISGNVGIGTTSPGSKLQVAGDITPEATGTRNLGSSSLYWNALYANNIYSPSSGTSGYWQRNAQALSPTNITDDVLLGATATSSALVKLTGTSGNNSWINTGNVGIGTTGPSKKLHVAGECVAEDSLVPVAQCQMSNVKCQMSNKQIKDVKPGDRVLSLNENTGEFAWQKVEKTLDKGIQEVYELKTESGKRIETTGNHPYLTPDGWKKVIFLKEREEIAVANLTHLEEGNIESNHPENNRQDINNSLNTHNSSLFQAKVGINNYNTTHNHSNTVGNQNIISNHRPSLLKSEANFKNNIQEEIEIKEAITSFIPNVLANKGAITPAESQATAPLVKNSEYTLGSPFNSPIDNHSTTSKLGDVKPHHQVPFSVQGADPVNPQHEPYTNSIKKANAKEYSGVKWEKIVSIKPAGKKHVYDLQIANTANFVANGIVAHNTYIANDLTLAEDATISGTLALGPQVQAYAGTCDASSEGKMYYDNAQDEYYYCDGSSWKAVASGASGVSGSGTQNYLPKWSTSSSLTDSIIYETGGQIGIGTTSPLAKLDVSGDASVSGNLYLASGGAVRPRNAGLLTLDYKSGVNAWTPALTVNNLGNVGIGTTAPSEKLDITGNLRVNGNGTDNYLELMRDPNVDFRIISTDNPVYGLAFKNQQSGAYPFRINSSATSDSLVLSSGNVGIGTTSPGAKLEIAGTAWLRGATGTTGLFVNSSGNVGIGLTNPGSALQVAGDITPEATGTRNLGSSSLYWNALYANNIYSPSSGTSGYWQRNAQALSPTNITDDVLLGATATSSALVKLTGTSGNNSWINTGNVGIGTTSPAQKLHVEGQCVTGDSLLPIVATEDTKILRDYDTKSENKKEKSPNISFVQIKDIKGGELVLSLNEKTGKIEPAKIKGLLDMGVKPVYRLTTEDGRQIRTTGNHPYLVRNWQDLLKESNIKQEQSDYGQTKSNSGSGVNIENINFVFGAHNNFLKTNATPKENIPSNTSVVKTNNFLLPFSLAKLGTISTTPNQPADKLTNRSDTIDSQIGSTPLIKNNLSEENSFVNAEWTKVIYLRPGMEIATADTSDGDPKGLLRGGGIGSRVKWAKIASIEYVGEEQVYDIEVEGTHNFVANGIVAHNTYILNDLTLAEDATISGTLSLGPQVQAYAGTCNAAAEGKMYYDNAADEYYYCNGSSWKAVASGASGVSGSGTQNYIPKWSTSSTLTDSILYETGSQIGIGTTSPLATLDIAGSASASGNLTFRGSGTAHLINLYDNGSLQIGNSVGGGTATPAFVVTSAGNIGIGTTGPTYKLEVAGTGYFNGGGIYASSGFLSVSDGNPVLTYSSRKAFLPNAAIITADSAVGAASIPLIIKGTSGQTGDLTQWQNSDGGVLSVVDKSGNVGIGTTSPSQKLDIAGNATISGTLGFGPNAPAYAGTCNASNKGKQYYDGTDDKMYYCNGTSWIVMGTSSSLSGTGTQNYIPKWSGSTTLTDSIIYETGSQIGIGTTSPLAKLDVSGDASVSGNLYLASGGAVRPRNAGLLTLDYKSGVNAWTPALTVNTVGNVGIGTTGPGSFKLNVDDPGAGSPSKYPLRLQNSLGAETLDFEIETVAVGRHEILSSGSLAFGTGGTRGKVVIDTTGNVGIGDASPAYLLTVGSGDLFGVNSSGYALLPAGAAATPSLTFTGDTNTGLYSTAADKLGLVAGGTETMTITNGNVGIGTTGPSAKLSVYGTTSYGQIQAIASTANAEASIGFFATGDADSTKWIIGKNIDTGGKLSFYQGGTRMVIDSGNVGIGTTSPSQKLDIAGNATISGTLALGPQVQAYAGTCNASSEGKMYYDNANNEYYYCDGSSWKAVASGTSGVSGSGTQNYIPKWSTSSTLTDSIIYETGSQIGIGTTSPLAKLDVSGDASVSGNLYLAAGGEVRPRTSGSLSLSYKSGVDSWTPALTVNNLGNVGIGTTDPGTNKLKVIGECVEENSLIEVRREKGEERSEKREGRREKIKDIKPGDQVLSLNEQTGKFEWQKVEKTLDKGIQEVYELKTESGKRIETTGNHPYLTKEGWEKVVYLNKNQEIAVLTKGVSSTLAGKTPENKDSNNHGQQDDNRGRGIRHNLSFSNKKINENNNRRRHRRGEGISRPEIHFLPPLLKYSINNKETPPQTREATTDLTSSTLILPVTNEGTTPAANQTTAKLAQNSVNALRWSEDNFLTDSHSSINESGDVKSPTLGWEKIVSIKKTGTRHVYDLQIANTANFVANGIVAHNTYIQGSTADSTKAGLQVYNSSGTSLLYVRNDGNVGIGTTGPSWALNVKKDSTTEGQILAEVSSTAYMPAIALIQRGSYSWGMQMTTTNGDFQISDESAAYPGTPRMFIQRSSGNVGIGTTSPTQKLHVEGQCVTGDSLLPIVATEDTKILRDYDTKSENKKEKSPNISFVQIKDIKGGEYVLSLNEKTGKIEPAKIKGLLDMGVKPVYRLTTEDGRQIRTTGNHPYLVKLSSLGGFGAEISSEKQEQQGNGNNSQNTKGSRRVENIKPVDLIHNLSSNLAKYQERTKNIVTLPNPFVNIKNSSGVEETPVKDGVTKVAIKNALAMSKKKSESNLASFKSKTIKNNLTDNHSPVNGQWTKVIYLKPGMEIAVADTSDEAAKGTPPRWPKDSSDGEGIGSRVKWAKIASIEYVGHEQVYDIEVEGTHNFVANGIVAHNTYILNDLTLAEDATISGTLSLGPQVQAYAGTCNASSEGKMYYDNAQDEYYYCDGSSWKAVASGASGVSGSGTQNYIPKWSTSSSLTDSIIYETGSQIGIGTTSPLATLDVSGDASVSSNLYLASGGAVRPRTNGILTLDYKSGVNSWTPALTVNTVGNVGIGTTGPSTKLHIYNGDITIENPGSPGVARIRNTASGSDVALGTDTTANQVYLKSGGNVGIGTTAPDSKLSVRGTATQLELEYDGSNQTTFTVSSGGDLTIAPSGGDVSLTANLLPSATSTYNLGSSALYWNNLYVNNIYAPGTGTSGYWQRNAGALSPTNITDDLLIGGTATNSAYFQVIGTGASAGYLRWGSGSGAPDTNLYRSAANRLGTDDQFFAASNVALGSGGFFDTTKTTMSREVFTNTSGEVTALYTEAVANPASASTANFYGHQAQAYGMGAQNIGALWGTNAKAIHAGSGTVTQAAGNYASIENTSNGTVNNAYSFYTSRSNLSTGTITNAYGFYVGDAINSGGGTLSNNYGIYIGNQTAGGSTDIGLYIADADTYSLQLASTDGDAASGITFGTDTNLYRSAANWLKTDDSLDIVGDASASGSLVLRGTSPGTIDVLNGSRLDFQTSVGGDAGLTPRMTITNAGNVGIGTTGPGARFVVQDSSSSNPSLILSDGTANRWTVTTQGVETLNYGNILTFDSNNARITSSAGLGFRESGRSSDTMLLASGNVGIGTTGPGAKLHVSGGNVIIGAGFNNAALNFAADSDTALIESTRTDNTQAGIIYSTGWGQFYTSGGFGVGGSPGAGNNILYVSGNVGIGTTGPVQKLHVEGQCVTGDTLLSIVTQDLDKQGEVSEDRSSKSEVQIKDVQPGTLVYSRNEQTGKVQPAKINKLLDMGIKPVFKLKTESGKEIRTTGNHPYLVQLTYDEYQRRVQLRETGGLEKDYDLSQGSLSTDYEFSQTRTVWSGGSVKESGGLDSPQPSRGVGQVSQDRVYPVSLSSQRQPLRGSSLSQTGSGIRLSDGTANQASVGTNPSDSQNDYQPHQLSQNLLWSKVIYLQPGDSIATVSFSDLRSSNSEPYVVWDKIQSIKYVGEEQVYDIEVEGTHNFVGNGILAHNTYISGNVGIGTTSPLTKLHVDGTTTGKALTILNETGTVNDIFTASSSGTPRFTISNAGNITTTGTASFNSGGVTIDSSNYVNAARFVDTANTAYFLDPAASTNSLLVAGNVGIGTTSPNALLEVLKTTEQLRLAYNASNYTSFTIGASGQLTLLSTVADTGSNTAYLFNTANTLSTGRKLFDIQNNGVSKWSLDAGGSSTQSGSLTVGGAQSLISNSSGDITINAASNNISLASDNLINVGNLTMGGIASISGTPNLTLLPTSGLSKIYTLNAGDLAFYTSVGGDAGATERLRITNAGNIGIGTTSPTVALDIERAGDVQLDLTNSTAGKTWRIENLSSKLTFTNLGVANVMTLDGSNVGIGTTSPAYLTQVGSNIWNNLGSNFKLAVAGDIVAGTSTSGSEAKLRLYEGTAGAYIQMYKHAGYGEIVDSEGKIYMNGNVGIGTTGPSYKLDVSGDINFTGQIRKSGTALNIECTTSADCNGITGNTACSNISTTYKCTSVSGGGSCPGTCNPGWYAQCCRLSNGFDLAEMFPASMPLEPGELVAVDPNNNENLVRTTKANQGDVLGIISTAPAITLDGDMPEAKFKYPLALAGRVPVKVSGIGGSIKRGDFLTASPVPGRAMKATGKVRTIGIALSPFETNGDINALGEVTAFANLSWNQDSPPEEQIQAQEIVTKTIKSTDGNWLIDELGVATLNKVVINTKKAVDVAEKVLEIKDSLGKTIASIDEAGTIFGQRLIAEKKIISPVVETGIISPLPDSSEIVISLKRSNLQGGSTSEGSGFGKLLVQNEQGETVASIDSSGSASFAGQVTSETLQVTQDATVSGTLYADKIETKEISALRGSFGELLARLENLENQKTASNEAALVSPASSLIDGPVKLDNNITDNNTPVKSQSQEGVELSGVEPDGRGLTSPSSQPANPTPTLSYANETATASSLLAETQSWPITDPSSDLKITANLKVLGRTSLADTTVAGQLMVDGAVVIDSTGINSLPSSVLRLQSSGWGPVDILAGKMTIDTDGNVQVAGNLAVGGEISASGLVLKRSNLSGGSTSPEESAFGKLLAIQNPLGETVASIDASGSAQFASLVIAADYSATQSASLAEIRTNATSGLGILPAGSTEFTIFNPKVSENTLVYLTPVSDTQNKVLYVSAKKSGEWFKVGIDTPIDQEIRFNWWIIN
ncbi:MAG: phage integrase SAM-like domain-containing protein [Patescibacteria group bacterium]